MGTPKTAGVPVWKRRRTTLGVRGVHKRRLRRFRVF